MFSSWKHFSMASYCTVCAHTHKKLHLIFSIRTTQAYICDTSRRKTQWSVKYVSDKSLVISMERVTVFQTYPVMVAGAKSEDLNINTTGVMMWDFILLTWKSTCLYWSNSPNGNCFCELRFLLKYLCDENLILHVWSSNLSLIQSWTSKWSSSSSYLSSEIKIQNFSVAVSEVVKIFKRAIPLPFYSKFISFFKRFVIPSCGCICTIFLCVSF